MKEQVGIEQKADILGISIESAQGEAEIKNAAIRQAERQQKYDAWKDPEGMAYRKAIHEKGALESLWALRDSGNCVIPFPIPPEDQLPKECRGQQPSTIRSMLRGHSEWRAKMDAHAALAQRGQDTKSKLQESHPELFGIDYTKLRLNMNPEFEMEKVRDGRKLNVKVPEGFVNPGVRVPKWTPSEPKKSGLVARIFAGVKDLFEEIH